jgi:hypothetical protein
MIFYSSKKIRKHGRWSIGYYRSQLTQRQSVGVVGKLHTGRFLLTIARFGFANIGWCDYDEMEHFTTERERR